MAVTAIEGLVHRSTHVLLSLPVVSRIVDCIRVVTSHVESHVLAKSRLHQDPTALLQPTLHGLHGQHVVQRCPPHHHSCMSHVD